MGKLRHEVVKPVEDRQLVCGKAKRQSQECQLGVSSLSLLFLPRASRAPTTESLSRGPGIKMPSCGR